MTYGIFEEFPGRTVSYKLLRALALALNALAFNIAETQNMAHTTWTCYNDLQLFDRKSSGGTVTHAWSDSLVAPDRSAIESEVISNQQIAEEFYKPIIRKCEK